MNRTEPTYDEIGFAYYSPMTAGHRLVFDLVPPVTAEDVRVVTDSMMGLVRVVPNPFVMFSAYQQSFTESRLAFTNVPPAGTLRIYTVSGQFVQQIEWTPADLSGGGDLFYDLRTREGYDLASGLY
ncbi:MAG: hypothetical protein ACE5FJ_05665, partial [Gemmatimonadales bacterium]